MGKKRVISGSSTLEIEEFKLSDMVEYASIVMVAKRGSGKSYVCRSILDHFCKIPVGLIIAPTDEMNCFYGNFFPKTYIHYEYKSEILENLLTRQKIMIKKEKERKEKGGRPIDARSFVVMDDCLSTKGSWAKDKSIKQLLFDGRHYKIMYILTMQFPLGILPELRTNFDYIFLLADDFVSTRKKLHEHYAGMFPTLAVFVQVFEQLTADFGCMVIINRGQRHSFSQKVMWYKAPAKFNDNLSRGCKQFNDFHNKNYDPEWYDKKNGINIDDIIKNKKIKVTKLEHDI